MPESATTTAGPSLEQILWRAMDRWEERPSLIDSDEFAAHIAEVFDGDVPAEAWVQRFFDGADKMHKAPSDMAEAIVRATKDRLQVYEFDLKRLEYVIVEDDDKVVVVSDFGQFALQNDDLVQRAISSAIIPAAAPGGDKTPDRAKGAEPKAYFVRASGEVVAVDVKKVARSLEQLLVRQVSMPAVSKPGARLAPFAPARRALTEAREARALRQDVRARQAIPLPARLARTRAGDAARAAAAPAPAGAKTALFLLMPDGTLARPEMGSATRWQEMVGNYARSAAASVPVTHGQKITIQAGNVVAIINQTGTVTTVGERSMARAEGISAVRADSAPIRVLGDDQLAQALAHGAMVVPGLSRADQFWIQPEAAFKPDERKLSQGGQGASLGTITAGQPLQLGEITGDPWSDWALTGGGEMSPELMTALRGRTRAALRKALGDSSGSEISIAPELASKVRGARGRDLALAGAPVVGFRAADGSIVVQRGADAPIRLAALGRVPGLDPIDLQLPGTTPSASPSNVELGMQLQLPGTTQIAARSGAVPATALAALQMALEQTASAGGYKLPMVKMDSARDAQEIGAAMDLMSFDERRTQVRLAAAPSFYDGGPGGQVAQLVLSMPFPNTGELHVGPDLADALQAYLGGQIQPGGSGPSPFGSIGAGALMGTAAGAGALAIKFRGGGAGAVDEMPLDWGGLHGQAIQRAQDAVITLDLPAVQPLVAGSVNTSGLPILLQKALGQSGTWTPGPGAPMPLAIRDFSMRGPFDLTAGLADLAAPPMPGRALNPGEEEIVIPMPLWAQMGRGQLSETDQIMASPLAPAGYAPPMGIYRLVLPAGGPIDMTGGAPSGTPGIVELNGPAGLELVMKPADTGVFASSLGGKTLLGRVAIDDGETVVTRRGRMRVGAPLSPDQKPYRPSENAQAPETPEFKPSENAVSQDASQFQAGSNVTTDTPAYQPTENVLSQGGTGPDSAATVVSGAQPSMPSMPDVPTGSYVNGQFVSTAGNATSQGSSGMAGALTSAMQMSNDVAARTSVPGRPSIGLGANGSPNLVSDSSGFSSRAQAAGQAQAGSPGSLVSGSSSASPSAPGATGQVPSLSPQGSTSLSGSTPSTTPARSAQLDSSGASDQTLVATAAEGSMMGVSAGSAVSDMTSSSSSARRAREESQGSTPSFITGLQPGMWSGNRRTDTLGYQNWSYSSANEDRPRTAGGVDLTALSRPVYPSLPTALRFRYVGAPLWWSGSSRSGAMGGAGDSSEDGETSSPATRAMRAGLRAATSAASIWRSILVANPQWNGGEDLSGGMDAGHEQNAGEMSSLARGFDALTAGSLVGAGAAAGAGAGYVAVSSSGAAGTVSKSAAARARADSVEMSIVAAIPPAPPPLETMSSATAGDVPHARGKGHGHKAAAGGEHKENADAVSHSKIEGSVDAIAQRIYHRIRRRIQSDRERFGG